MNEKRIMLLHFLAALAYRTQKALRNAPVGFSNFDAGLGVRTPHQLVHHMDSVMGYAKTFFVGGSYRMPLMPNFSDEVERFHLTLAGLAQTLEGSTTLGDITMEQLLQGPFSDAMTHAGQLAMLRRLAGSHVQSENFIFADINSNNLGSNQPLPVSPDNE